MKIDHVGSKGIFVTENFKEEQPVKQIKKQKQNSFFAGDIPISSVEEKRKKARKEAWDLVSNAWEADQEFDKEVKNCSTEYDKLAEERKQFMQQRDSAKKVLEDLKEEYGDTPEGKRDIMEAEKMLSNMEKQVNRVASQMEAVAYNEKEIAKEQLKQHGMVDARKEADQIIEGASQEIIHELINEARDHMEEVQKEAEEKQEKIQEQKEEEEELIQERSEERLEEKARILKTKESIEAAKREHEKNSADNIKLPEMTEMVAKSTSLQEVQSEIDNIKNSMNLIEADLKGIKVDETL